MPLMQEKAIKWGSPRLPVTRPHEETPRRAHDEDRTAHILEYWKDRDDELLKRCPLKKLVVSRKLRTGGPTAGARASELQHAYP